MESMIDQVAFGVQSMLAVLVLLFLAALVFKPGYLNLVWRILHAIFTNLTKTTIITLDGDHPKSRSG